MNKITCICLGVRNMSLAVRFYRDELGFETNEKGNEPQVVFFNTPGTKFELYPLELLPKDISETNPPKVADGLWELHSSTMWKDAKRWMWLSKRCARQEAGLQKNLQETFWGGYHAYFSDLDGDYWEVAQTHVRIR